MPPAQKYMTLRERWSWWTGTDADHYVSLKTLLDVMNNFDRTFVLRVATSSMFDAVHELYSKSNSGSKNPTGLAAKFSRVDKGKLYAEGEAKAMIMVGLFDFVHNDLFEMLRKAVGGKQGDTSRLEDVTDLVNFSESNNTIMTYATARSVVSVKFNKQFISALRKLYKAALVETDRMIDQYATVGAREVLEDSMKVKILKMQQKLVQMHGKYSQSKRAPSARMLNEWDFVTNVEYFTDTILKYAGQRCEENQEKVARTAQLKKGQNIKSAHLGPVVKHIIRNVSCDKMTIPQLAQYVSVKMEEAIKHHGEKGPHSGRHYRSHNHGRGRGFSAL